MLTIELIAFGTADIITSSPPTAASAVTPGTGKPGATPNGPKP